MTISQELGHGLEGPAHVVLIQAGHDDAHAAVREAVHDPDQSGVEELPFVDADDLRVRLDEIQQRAGAADRARWNPHLAVRDDVVVRVPRVERRLEDLDFLARDLGAAQPADQLLGLAAVHAADDDLDPPVFRSAPNDFHAQTRD